MKEEGCREREFPTKNEIILKISLNRIMLEEIKELIEGENEGVENLNQLLRVYLPVVNNVKVKYIRPAFNNLREWMSDSNNVYIGRKGIVFIDNKRFPSADSIWANPFKIDNHHTREDVIVRYRTYIKQKIRDEHLDDELQKLCGKHLGCWCYPEPCHGDVLVELIGNSRSL